MSDTQQTPPTDPEAVMKALAAPFEADEVKFKPATISGNRCLALHYVDARVVQDRLDDVLGIAGWQDEYTFLDDGSVLCALKLRVGGEWLTKMDVGGESEQSDGGDRRKAAVSDALKRAAVKFGIGRYLYRLPSQWVDYDPQKKRIVRPPQLPASALPPRKAAPAKAPPPREPGHEPEPVDTDTVNRIEELLGELKVRPADVRRRLMEKYGVNALTLLDADQAGELLEQLRKSKAVQKAPAPRKEKQTA